MPYLHAISLTQALLGQERLFKSKNIHIQLSPCLLCACSCSVVKNECRDCECKTWYPGVDGAMHPCLDYPILKMRLSKTSCLKKKHSPSFWMSGGTFRYIYIFFNSIYVPSKQPLTSAAIRVMSGSFTHRVRTAWFPLRSDWEAGDLRATLRGWGGRSMETWGGVSHV